MKIVINNIEIYITYPRDNNPYLNIFDILSALKDSYTYHYLNMDYNIIIIKYIFVIVKYKKLIMNLASDKHTLVHQFQITKESIRRISNFTRDNQDDIYYIRNILRSKTNENRSI